MKQIKIAVIGGGSSYTPELVEGIIKKRESLPVSEIVLIDVAEGEEKVQINNALVKRMFSKAQMKTKISYSTNRIEALKGADFVMAQLRVGGLQARAMDEKIPLQYGMVGQETTGMGGFFKALRTIPVMMAIAKDMEAVCPEAWLINFTNPSGIITEVIRTRTKVKCVGLCNVPINMHYEAAERLGVGPEDIKSNFIGLNHLSVMNQCYLKGYNVIDDVLDIDETFESENQVKNIEKIDAMDLLARDLGLVLSPYMQYFFFESDMIKEEQESMDKGKGSRAEQVMKVEEDLFQLYKNEDLDEKPHELSLRGGSRYSEAAIALINSIHNDTGDVQVVNTLNNGSISDLPLLASVEVNCIIDQRGATPIANGPLPQAISSLVKMVKVYEQYTIEAALDGDKDKAMLALVNNPLVHNMREAKEAFETLLDIHGKYLPQFRSEEDE